MKVFYSFSTKIMNSSKLASHLFKIFPALSVTCLLAMTYPAKAQETRRQNVTGEGFQGICTLDDSVSLRSGPSFRSTYLGATAGAVDTIKVHGTENHNGLWSWVTVYGVEDIDAWVDSNELYNCEGSSLYKTMPYVQARAFITSQGWRPVEVDIPSSPARFGIDYLISLGFTETVSCSGTGIGLCVLRFYNTQGEVLDVLTVGNNPNWGGPKVYSWYRVSP